MKQITQNNYLKNQYRKKAKHNLSTFYIAIIIITIFIFITNCKDAYSFEFVPDNLFQIFQRDNEKPLLCGYDNFLENILFNEKKTILIKRN